MLVEQAYCQFHFFKNEKAVESIEEALKVADFEV